MSTTGTTQTSPVHPARLSQSEFTRQVDQTLSVYAASGAYCGNGLSPRSPIELWLVDQGSCQKRAEDSCVLERIPKSNGFIAIG
jgi:hypothetical protein